MSVTEVATAEAASAASTDVTASEAIVEQVLSAEAASIAATDAASEAIVEQVLSAEAASIAAYTLTATTVPYTMTFDLIALLYLLLLAASIKKLAELV
jgi:hypothetical protein